MPKTVSTFFEEMLSSSSLSFKLIARNLVLGHIIAFLHHADTKIKNKFLPKIVEGKWSGTMCAHRVPMWHRLRLN